MHGRFHRKRMPLPSPKGCLFLSPARWGTRDEVFHFHACPFSGA